MMVKNVDSNKMNQPYELVRDLFAANQLFDVSASYHCESRKTNTLAARPIKKPNESEKSGFGIHPLSRKWKNLLCKSTNPFFKNQWLLPRKKPRTRVAKGTQNYHFRHSITHTIFRDADEANR